MTHHEAVSGQKVVARKVAETRMHKHESAVLVVDDEPDVSWALERILAAEGLRVERAETGRQAIAAVTSMPFKLILLDAKLPDADGCELARTIRELCPAAAIVMVSGFYYRNDPSIRQALAEGVIHGFIGKPFCHSDVTKLLHPWTSSPDCDALASRLSCCGDASGSMEAIPWRPFHKP